MFADDTEQIVFDLVAQDQWRILDGRRDQCDIAALLGFVEIVAGVYEVILFRDPGTPRFCTSLDEVRSQIGTEDAIRFETSMYKEHES